MFVNLVRHGDQPIAEVAVDSDVSRSPCGGGYASRIDDGFRDGLTGDEQAELVQAAPRGSPPRGCRKPGRRGRAPAVHELSDCARVIRRRY
jgi:hypothetical protein